MEIECAIQQRRDADRDEAAMTKLHELKAHAAADDRHERISRAYKLTLIEQARENGAQKNAIADALGISRPTLDKWLQEQDDRALFNDALYLLSKADMRPEDREAAYMALGIRDTNQQAHVVFDLTKYGTDHLTTVQRDRVLQAEQRAQAML